MTTPFIPGQDYVGSKVNTAPQVFTQAVQTQAGITAGGLAPKITALAAAGSLAAVSAQVGYDQAGSFVLTAGTTPTGGSICTVTFGRPLNAAPSSVLVACGDQTNAATTSINVSAISVTKTGFTVFAGSAATLAHTYLISYQVIK